MKLKPPHFYVREVEIMEGELKRKYLAIVEELEIDDEGRPVLLEAPEEVHEVPSVEAEPIVEAVEEPAVEVEVEPVAEETTEPEEITEPVEEAAEEPAAEEPAETNVEVAVENTEPAAETELPGLEVAAAVDAIGTVPAPKYVNKNFAQKMIAADEVIQDRYDEVKNYALRFKKLKARISKKFESINQGRLQFVKLSVAGKTLKLYLNMDISEVDPKFRCKDMSNKVTYETVPVMLRIKSGRAVRYAKMLIDQCAAKYGLVENKKFVEVDSMQVIEDFLAEREAKKLAKAAGADDDDDALEETAVTSEE